MRFFSKTEYFIADVYYIRYVIKKGGSMKKLLLVSFMLISIVLSKNVAEAALSTEEMLMEKAESIFYDPPLPVTLVGTKSGDQVNFMTAAWFARVEVNPYMFAVSIQKKHFTHQAIIENKCFSISIPAVDLIPQVDAVGMVSGKEYDKSDVFDVFYGDNEKSPMVNGSIVSFECELVNEVSLQDADETHPRAHTLFIGEVKNVWVNKNGVKDDALDYDALKPIMWTFSPMSYWTIGTSKGKSHNPDNMQLVPKKK